MWLTLYLALLVFLAYQSFFWSPLHLYVVGCVLYVLVYLLHPEKREWHWFRSWSFWDFFRKWYFPHHIHSVHWGDLAKGAEDGKVHIFMVVNPVSLVDTVLAFGLHGKRNPVLNRLSPLIVAPMYLFYVPYVTDAAQWAGLVPERTRSKDYTEIVNDILSGEDFAEFSGLKQSLVVPHYTRSSLTSDEDSLKMLEWAAERARHGLTNLCLVPVMHRGSSRLYRTCCQSAPAAVAAEPLHWRPPWPFFGFGFMCSCLPRRTELNTFVGRPIPVSVYQDNMQVLVETFSREMTCLRKAADANTIPDDNWDIEKGDT